MGSHSRRRFTGRPIDLDAEFDADLADLRRLIRQAQASASLRIESI